MDNSAVRPSRTWVVAGCCLTALLGLLLLASEPGSVTTDRIETAAPETINPRASGPGGRVAENTMTNARADEFPRSYFATQQQPDDLRDPEVTPLDEVVRRTQGDRCKFERFEAISALGDSREPNADWVLANLLYDHDSEVREAALESLGTLGTLRATQGLGYALTDANPFVRRTAIEILAEIGTRDALAALANTLNDPDIDLRLAAVYELADNESMAASALMQRFLSDTDPLVTQVAAEFLNDESELRGQ